MRNSKVIFALLAALLIVGMIPAAAQDEMTLVVWDNFTRDAEQEMIETLNAMFEEANPGVTVVREAYTTDDLGLLLPRELSAATGPDVTMINQGLNNMAALVEAGLLLPLNDYADEFDWWSRYGLGLHARNSVTADGAQFGSGDLYGVSNTAEVVAIFYNKRIFADLSLDIPTTFEEFEAALATIAEADITPITFGNLDAWPGIHTYGAINHAYSDLADIDDFMYRNEGGTFAYEGAVTSAEQVVAWAEAGYFSNGFEGLDNDNGALVEFTSGESAMWLAGSWNSGSIIDVMGEEAVGFFLMPSPLGEEVAPTIGGVGLAYGIGANSENPDLAAAYIDLVTSPEAAALLFEQGFLPAVAVDESLLTEGTLTADLVNAWNTISAADKVGHYFDWTVSDVGAFIQELLAGVVTPEEFVATVDEAYQAGQ
ncbi:MAG: extracellular solute-binding protein [Chloroflexi bacterium]|nr:extracellular solute-binding protein [Chloroflexota bacterium]